MASRPGRRGSRAHDTGSEKTRTPEPPRALRSLTTSGPLPLRHAAGKVRRSFPTLLQDETHDSRQARAPIPDVHESRYIGCEVRAQAEATNRHSDEAKASAVKSETLNSAKDFGLIFFALPPFDVLTP
jgi:hypothetical protein